jgi:hypothetical protein
MHIYSNAMQCNAMQCNACRMYVCKCVCCAPHSYHSSVGASQKQRQVNRSYEQENKKPNQIRTRKYCTPNNRTTTNKERNQTNACTIGLQPTGVLTSWNAYIMLTTTSIFTILLCAPLGHGTLTKAAIWLLQIHNPSRGQLANQCTLT